MNSPKPLVRYAVSILLSLPASERETVLGSLGEFASALRDTKVRDFFLSPIVSVEEKVKILEGAKFPSTDKFRAFWSYLFTEKVLSRFEEILSGIRDALSKASGETVGVVKIAAPLTEDQRAALMKKVVAMTGAKSVKLEEQVDTSELSGFTLRVGGTVVQGNWKGKLERIQEAF